MPVITCSSTKCTTEIKNTGKPCVDPTVEFVGAVLATGEKNGLNDSDFYAIVWDEESQKVRHITYGSTAYWTYHNRAQVDATPDTIEKAERYFRAELFQILKDNQTREAKNPVKGKHVRSLMTRGTKKDISGEIKWRGPNKFRTYYRNGYNQPEDFRNQVVGIKVEGREKLVYIDAPKVEVINPEQYIESDEQIQERANSLAATHRWGAFLNPYNYLPRNDQPHT